MASATSRTLARQRPGVVRYRSEHWLSGWSPIDFAFALAFSALFLGDIVGPLPSTAFILAVGLVGALHLNSRFDFRRFGSAFPFPLMVFLGLHVGLSLAVSVDNFLTRLIQTVIAITFTSLVYYRYSKVSMEKFLRYSGMLVGCVLLYAVLWHFAQGIYMPLKYFYETKTIFSFVATSIFFLWSRRPTADRTTVWRAGLVALLVVVLLISGERKAYITMGLSLPFLIDLRKPSSFGIILACVGLVILTAAIDSSGYVGRQLETLLAFGQGKVENTVSNLTREWQLHHAMATFRESPLWGVGTNGYSGILKDQYLSAPKTQLVILPDVGIHGEGLRVLVENGVVGIAALIILLVYSFWVIFNPVFHGRAKIEDRAPSLLVLFAMLFYLGFEAFDMTAIVFYGLLPIVGRLRWGLGENGFASSQRLARRRDWRASRR